MAIANIRSTMAIVDLSAIQHNLRRFRTLVGPHVTIMAVVKADGYGHGALPVAKAALAAGAGWLGVAVAEEGVALREEGIRAPILVLGPNNRNQIAAAIRHGLDVVVYSRDSLEWTVETAQMQHRLARIHLKLDTGMGRIGIPVGELDQKWLSRLSHPSIEWRGLMSHMADADDPDEAPTREQLKHFLDAAEWIRQRRGDLPQWLHLANSAATLRWPDTHFNLVRVGIGLYGVAPVPGNWGLIPALTWQSRIAMVKSVVPGTSQGYGRTYHAIGYERWATVPVGYADGYFRALSNRAVILVGGRRCPVVGRVSMDQLVIRLPNTLDARIGDVVTLIGSDGGDQITANELADHAGTIAYEIVTRIGPRVPRRYLHGS